MRQAIHPEAQIIAGLALDDSYGDEVSVTVIAAGFDAKNKIPKFVKIKNVIISALENGIFIVSAIPLIAPIYFIALCATNGDICVSAPKRLTILHIAL